jgi:hypothetical protein
MTSQVSASHDPGGLRARLEARRGEVIAIAARYGAHNVRLFGPSHVAITPKHPTSTCSWTSTMAWGCFSSAGS